MSKIERLIEYFEMSGMTENEREAAAALRMLRDVAEAAKAVSSDSDLNSKASTESMRRLVELDTALAATPVPGEKLRAGTETADDAARRFAGQCMEKDARIAELEAAYNELIMAVAQKFYGETRHQTALRYIVERESPPPAAKPDPRLTAPNGRAMVVFYNTERGMRDGLPWGIDDQGTPWCWTIKGEWSGSVYTNEEELIEDGIVPCTFDGTPITETKPEPGTCKQSLQVDPLARAVTVGEFNEKMLRLAAMMDGLPSSSIASVIVKVFQGAEHVE